jgi:hypothetical protein
MLGLWRTCSIVLFVGPCTGGVKSGQFLCTDAAKDRAALVDVQVPPNLPKACVSS